MNNLHSNTQFELGKDKMRGFHQEQEATRLARQVRRVQPNQIKAALNQVLNFLKRLTLKKSFGFRRMVQDKPLVRHDLPI